MLLSFKMENLISTCISCKAMRLAKIDEVDLEIQGLKEEQKE